jgi:FkbM family methyltransferase
LWDVGGFLGTFGLGVTQFAPVPPACLLTVEPNPEVLPYLEANLARNARCIHKIAPYAVAQRAGRLQRRCRSGDNNAGGISYEQASENGDFVKSLSLEDLRGEFGAYDVLKLDVEGMEVDAILGDLDYISSRQPIIWVECNETSRSILLLETLCRLKYKPLYVAFPAFRVQNFKKSGEKIFPMAYEAALLAAPRNRLDMFIGKVAGEELIVRSVLTPDELRRALWDTPRWSMPEWVDLKKAELVALLGRQHKREDFQTFLNLLS